MRAFMMPEIPSPWAVVCHDAGAANIILAWLAVHPTAEVQPFMAGPAVALWAALFPLQPLRTSVADALRGARTLISGTGWQSHVEHDARALASAQGIPSVAVLDHWVNYEARFRRDGARVLPDALWAADPWAVALARQTFPRVPVREIRNYYLEGLARDVGPAPTDGDVLYVLEPIRGAWGRHAPGEFEALDFFTDRLPHLPIPAGTRIRLRPHPSDPAGKYEGWVATRARLPLVVETGVSLADAMSRARWVVGCESMAMVVALAAGREVWCSLPPWAPPCRLPQSGINHLGKMADLL